MTTATMTPRIYVASLSDYNAGRLVGQWIDLDETTETDDLQAAINAMLATSSEKIAEEWAIHDYDDMPNLGEYPDLDTVISIAQSILEFGEPFRAWIDESSYNIEHPERFQDCYLGEYDSETDYAREYLRDNTDILNMLERVGFSEGYIDWEAYARDLFMDLDSIPNGRGGIYVFDPNA